MATTRRRGVNLAAASLTVITAAALSVRCPGTGKARGMVEHRSPRPVGSLARYQPDLSRGVTSDQAGARFVVTTKRAVVAEVDAAVFEDSDGTFLTLWSTRSREEAETVARTAGPEARLFAARPSWGMPARVWVSADPQFWKTNPMAGRA